MEMLIEILNKFDIANLFAMGIMFWFFYNRLDNKIDKIVKRLDKIETELHELDKRLCRLEGAFSAKDCCMIKDERVSRRAE